MPHAAFAAVSFGKEVIKKYIWFVEPIKMMHNLKATSWFIP